MRITLIFATLLVVAGCGGGSSRSASGAISDACLQADRRAASRALCSCVQHAANQTLSQGEQSRAAGFFADPETAQAVRTSDSSSDRAFWRRYTAFRETAEQMCRPAS